VLGELCARVPTTLEVMNRVGQVFRSGVSYQKLGALSGDDPKSSLICFALCPPLFLRNTFSDQPQHK
jgi:hypothetical protein